MQGFSPRWIVFSTLGLLALAGEGRSAGAAFDATLAGTYSKAAGGGYLYSYTVTVLADSTMPLTAIDLAIAVPVDASSVTSSANLFSLYNPGDTDIQFYYSYNDPNASGIGGTGSVATATFSFTSSLGGPGQVGYALAGNDPTSPFFGTAVGPVVPEPSSLLMCSIGAIGALGFARKARRRPVA